MKHLQFSNVHYKHSQDVNVIKISRRGDNALAGGVSQSWNVYFIFPVENISMIYDLTNHSQHYETETFLEPLDLWAFLPILC